MLPQDIVMVTGLGGFKRGLDKIMKGVANRDFPVLGDVKDLYQSPWRANIR